MTRIYLVAISLVASALAAPASLAEDVEYFVKDGIQYKRVRQVTKRPVSETRYESHTYTTHEPRYTTDFQEVQRTYQVPVTEQQWVPGYQRTLNIFAPPVLSYRLMPVTRWETRVHTVRVPVTRTDYVPHQHVTQVPITSQRLAQEEHTHVIAVGPASNGTLTANRNDSIGGTKLDNDPPRSGTQWRGGQ